MEDVLKIKNLNVSFEVYGGSVKAVRNFSLDIHQGEVYALVGESGCGKSTIANTILGLHDRLLTQIDGEVLKLLDFDLLDMSDNQMEQIRGDYVSMIFQDPITALNPTMKIGRQIVETLYRRKQLDSKGCKHEALKLLKLVQISDPEMRYNQYPHQLSGGMKQRVMIAMALSCHPQLLIADEPTTALDVTIQAQILNIILDIKKQLGTAVLLITHDFGVVASIADKVGVMYAGEIVEEGLISDIFDNPKHPYTQGLMKCLPDLNEDSELFNIPGEPPDLYTLPRGCAFSNRCPDCMNICLKQTPEPILVSEQHYTRCFKELPAYINATKTKE